MISEDPYEPRWAHSSQDVKVWQEMVSHLNMALFSLDSVDMCNMPFQILHDHVIHVHKWLLLQTYSTGILSTWLCIFPVHSNVNNTACIYPYCFLLPTPGGTIYVMIYFSARRSVVHVSKHPFTVSTILDSVLGVVEATKLWEWLSV